MDRLLLAACMAVHITNIITPSTSTTTMRANNSELEERRSRRRRLWARAVFMPLLLFVSALGFAYAMYRADDTVRTGSRPWRLLIGVAWWPYATLADVILSYMDLSLPLAPAAAWKALLVAYAGGGVLFAAIGGPVYAYGHAPAILALAFSLAAALAGLLAFWLWLDRTYRTVDYLPS